MKQYDYLIVGAGLYGAVFAHEAKKAGKRCLVIDKRAHIAGNIYTEEVEGINVHRYGAHIFHTNNKAVWQYVNQFAEFNRYTNSPVANYHGEIYNLPFNLMVPLTACIVPGVSACIARRDGLGAQRTTESAMRVSALIALPCGFGLFALGTPIIQLLTVGNVDESIAGPLLSILGIASLFVCIQVVASAILQANGIVNLPIITMVIGGVAKVIVSYTLVGNPKFMIFGAPIGTLTCFVVVSVLNLLIIKRMVPHPPRLTVVFFKPLIASLIMAAAAWGCQGLLAKVFHGSFLMNAVATAGGILAGVVVYVILIVALRVLSREDLEMMPKGDKIAKLLRIR